MSIPLKDALANLVIAEALRRQTARDMARAGKPPAGLLRAAAEKAGLRKYAKDSAVGVARTGVEGHLTPYSPSLSPSATRVTFVVLGNPLSLNHAYPTGKNDRRYPSKELRRWKAAVFTAAHGAGAVRQAGPVVVSVDAYFASVLSDLDNCMKPLLDGLKGVAFIDDRQVVGLHLRKFLDKDNPRAEVTVEGRP